MVIVYATSCISSSTEHIITNTRVKNVAICRDSRMAKKVEMTA